jgi:UDP-N-acetylmuramate dehydrogenase
MQIQENFNLKHFNTFHVSAHARYFAEVSSLDDLVKALAFQKQEKLPFMLIGQGSNLLFKEDYPGLIIELNLRGIEKTGEDAEKVLVCAAGGENWHNFVQYCLQRGYYGLENLSLIPGTVGAAPVQNIGAYGVELSDFLHELKALEISTGKLKNFSKENCQLAYRDSIFKNDLKDQYIITSVTFALLKTPRLNLSYPALQKALRDVPEERITPQLVSDTVCEIRRSKLPDPINLGNAGSFFRNPILSEEQAEALKAKYIDLPLYPYQYQYKMAAAWLIEKAGWKGFRKGDVGVHKDHALVLVNYGTASGAELFDLSQRIQETVLEQFGIALEPEVRII